MLRFILSAFALLLIAGCAFFMPDRIHYTFDPRADASCSDCVSARLSSDVIGVALSGGGSRASVYGAASLEILAEEGLLQRATYLSSVSGGGFPAAYYTLKKPTDFAEFKQAMRFDFLGSMTVRQLEKPNRISSPTRRLSSLQDVLDREFLNGTTYGELPQTPILLVNGARYDDARRFVFSTVAIPEEQSSLRQFSEQNLRTASFSLPGCARTTPKDFPVALAVATSAGFPPLLGPTSIKATDTCSGDGTAYWHIGDGGILDNSGVESIEDYALHAHLDGPPVRRLVIFSIDAGRSTAPTEMMARRNLKLWTSDPGRVVELVNQRANAYREVAIEKMADEAGIDITIIKMRYVDANIGSWPASCKQAKNDPEAIKTAIASVPTNLRISDCDADLMEAAAQDVVRRALDQHRDLLNSLEDTQIAQYP